MRTTGSAVSVVLLYPDLLGTYGDGGNATILAQRLRWRGQVAEVITVRSGDPVPAAADLYVLGGGEDLPQALAARQLGRHGPLHRAVEAGAAVLAVCAGLQILGSSFVGPDGVRTDGLGLVDAETTRGVGPRAVGELVVDPDPSIGLPVLTGYENHGGVTRLGPATLALGRVRIGVGNGLPTPTPGNGLATPTASSGVPTPTAGSGVPAPAGDGFVRGRIVGTYLHGPVLARNPALADHLLVSVVGPLEPLDDADSEELRRERLAVAGRLGSRAHAHLLGRSGRWPRWRRRDARALGTAGR